MIALVASIWSALFGCRRSAPVPDPRRSQELQTLGIFYGWPSAFDGAASVEQAVRGLGRYDVVVLGGGLQRADHGDHHATRGIIAGLRELGREVYGYIPLGASTGLSLDQIKAQVRDWKAMGVHGIFFDEAGYDYGNTRARQNGAFKLAHAQGLKAFANAWDPKDLFDTTRLSPHNPRGAPSALRAGDCYLYESFGLVLGKPESAEDRERKMAKLAEARRRGVRIFAVTTSPSAGFFDAEAWARVVAEARRLGLDGLGWGEHQFAAQDNRMPPRPFPAP